LVVAWIAGILNISSEWTRASGDYQPAFGNTRRIGKRLATGGRRTLGGTTKRLLLTPREKRSEVSHRGICPCGRSKIAVSIIDRQFARLIKEVDKSIHGLENEKPDKLIANSEFIMGNKLKDDNKRKNIGKSEREETNIGQSHQHH
jgi:hypothetical protein